MADQHQPLLPCPFCGAGTTEIREGGKVWLGTRYGVPISVSVWHWCDPTPGQPTRGIERIGKTEADAIAAWNRRAFMPPTDLAARAAWHKQQWAECCRKLGEAP